MIIILFLRMDVPTSERILRTNWLSHPKVELRQWTWIFELLYPRFCCPTTLHQSQGRSILQRIYSLGFMLYLFDTKLQRAPFV